MADIFISYASQDRDRIKRLAEALQTQGWSVWWDRDVPFGKPFDQVIEEALKNARCIIVAWSTHAVKSGWVIEEAQYGRDREILVPVLLDNVAIPFGFRRLQAASLMDWNDKPGSPVFQKLASDISAIIGITPTNRDNIRRQLPPISDRRAVFLRHPIISVVLSIIFILFILPTAVVWLIKIFKGTAW